MVSVILTRDLQGTLHARNYPRSEKIVNILRHSGIWEESILFTIGRPAFYDAGIWGKPLSGPN